MQDRSARRSQDKELEGEVHQQLLRQHREIGTGGTYWGLRYQIELGRQYVGCENVPMPLGTNVQSSILFIQKKRQRF